jgi:hypothetical protein
MSDFEVEISGESGGYRVAARSAAGDTSSVPVWFPFDDLALGRQLQALELALLRSSATVRRLTPVEEQPVQEFGRRLFEFAFPPELRAHLLASQQQTSPRIRLRVGPPELAALPWEFLYDPSEEEYLCLSTPLVRYLDVPQPRRPLSVAPPLRILAMIARPDELDSLDVEHERRRLTDALAELEAVGRVQLSWVGGQSWWDLQNALEQGGWHIFHFIGHGGLDTMSGEGVLAFAAEDGGAHRLGATDLARLLAEQSSLRLVVLNSCDTARATATDRFSSTASTLMRRGIPAVVAMQYEITDPAAIAFPRLLRRPGQPAPRRPGRHPRPAGDQTRPPQHPGMGHPRALPALAHRSSVRPHRHRSNPSIPTAADKATGPSSHQHQTQHCPSPTTTARTTADTPAGGTAHRLPPHTTPTAAPGTPRQADPGTSQEACM